MKIKNLQNKFKKRQGYILGLGTGILVTILILQLIPVLAEKTNNVTFRLPFVGKAVATPTPDAARQTAEVTREVLPEKVNLEVAFKDTIVKMVQVGAIDKSKFSQLYEGRGGMKPEEKKLLDSPSNDPIIIDQANANLILNLLWPLGIANKTEVLAQGPMGTQYKDQVGNFASTGGWTLGREDGGKLFNKYPILPMTKEQEATVKEIAENIYRPCCGNSTYFPDCNHGAAMLGFIELAVTQGMDRQEIYKKALALNSYWFPQTYVELAVFYKAKKNIAWNRVNPQEVLGVNYSSGQGYREVNKELQTLGLLPKVEGGGGCGV